MDCLRIAGGAPLHGSVRASGSKNAALPIMAAAILADGPVVLSGVPRLADVRTLARLLVRLGVEVTRTPDDALNLQTVDAEPTCADDRLVRRMRASFCVLGPLLARRGRAVVSLPGGCNLGSRPVDLHLAGLAALGADIRIERGYVVAEARCLRGAQIDLRGPCGPTVTGTANVMSAATLARGTTIITSAAVEPEIVDLGRFLVSLGAQINGLGSSTLEIRGADRLGSSSYRIIPDRIEAGTLLIAAAVAGGRTTVQGVEIAHLDAVLDALAASGASIACGRDFVSIQSEARPKQVDISAAPYPGFPTDLQAQWTALMATAAGTSYVRDTVFPNRFLHVDELRRLGAEIERRGSAAVVRGARQLSGAVVAATDLRASGALVLAALAAKGQTVVRRVEHLDRGYEQLDRKLRQLGARILRGSSGRVAQLSRR